ncbi:MAG: 30S ribosomal protein S1 [Candidatus Kerfeldbacteria bacterium CG_4_10_14_0_8_um_filter_42_10]|uniref:30S ribosomal protein S1 n=1 Tax=Candidatus Kerfeldbacteria bacterium CG_4_10_14_0_8_um_filter_42_10 TaxID=2014248 RepID=A0A2M7RIR8_9BACT|nr:MAG: 30S ribosomal protein S1 [Candidatus Kerfeldbacteria bacterium CG_4_10_14_0_8_um_filter_42_10]
MTIKTASKEKTDSPLAKLLSEEDKYKIPKVGEIIEGKVISISKTEVHLDIDGITTGVIRGTELIDESGEYSNLKLGDTAQATVLELENENCEIELSFRHAGHQKAWDRLINLKDEGVIVDAKIIEANKGGLIIKVGGVGGFLPVSQLIPEHYPRVEGGDKNVILERLTSFIGQKFRVKVIDVDEKEEKLIVSEKAAWEEKQKDVLSSYKIGDVVEGKVTGVVDFGAFVEFGEGLEGLVHISELAWQRIDDPRDIIKVGDGIKAAVIGIEGSKISLSIKKLKTDPWKDVVKKYKIGQVVKGKVLKINPFGVFVELDQDIHGLAHISELSDKLVHDPSDIVKIGETYPFKILSVEPENHRLGLSLKAANQKPDKNKVPELEKKEEQKVQITTPTSSPESKKEDDEKQGTKKDKKIE